MKNLILILMTFISLTASSQSSFRALPKKNFHSGRYGGVPNVPTSAFRFTGPMAGYMYPQNQVVTGLGYGWQKLHYIDNTEKYYTDFSISAVIYAGGNITPTQNNIISIGVSLGVLNQLLMVGPVYNFPKGDKKGSFGVVANFSVPLNN